jgi:hypothetical protein
MYQEGSLYFIESRIHQLAHTIADLVQFRAEYESGSFNFDFHKKKKIEREFAKKCLILTGTTDNCWESEELEEENMIQSGSTDWNSGSTSVNAGVDS